MATKVNPRLLEERRPVTAEKRNTSVSTLALMKSAISSLFDGKILKVEMQGQKEMQTRLEKVSALLESMVNQQKNMTIGKASLSTEKVDEFRVTNLEELKLENVEKLGLALEQLEPIITALNKGTQADQKTLGMLTKISNQFAGLSGVLKIIAQKDVRFPETQKVKGEVTVTAMPDHSGRVVAAVERLEKSITSFKAATQPLKMQAIGPSAIDKVLVEKLQDISDKLLHLPDNLQFPTAVEVSNFPPQKYPMPVTNISINALGGSTATTAVTVTTTATALPDEALESRRSMIIYNNSSSVLYIGGSDVTTTNGLPVPANSYSPALDTGENMAMYGIVASGTANVRVLELSDIRTGR